MKIFIITTLAMVALAAAIEEDLQNQGIEEIKTHDKPSRNREEWMKNREEHLKNREEHLKNREEHRSVREEEFKKRVGDFKEKWNAMTEEERQKIREMPHRPVHHFKDIPVEVRQKIKEKFESLSPEERQKLHDRFQRRFPEGARPYGVENVEKFKKHFENLPEEKKQLIREKFEKLTPEQREEIRKLRDHRQKIPAVIGPVPASDDFQRIRSPHEDIMINDKMVLDFKNDRRNPRFPAPIDGQDQKIRRSEDREKWMNELRAEKKKHNRA